jgi:4-alpha-glucanotransferase
MKKLKFLFGIHCHQPVGNFEEVFTEAFEKAYLPFIQVLENHPRIRVTIHYSGILFDWFKKNRPEFMDLLRKLVRRGQLEILSSGYYEPILSVIPDEDKLGQIEMQNNFIREEFGNAPQGLWLTERVWEPTLPKTLVKAGIEYIMLDDHHFKLAGIPNDDLSGYFVTEDEGETIKVFPIDEKLRKMIPFKEPKEVIKYLKTLADNDESTAVVCMDDGEKLGLRPESHKFVYAEGYLEELFREIEENSKWLTPMTFSEYIDEYRAKGRVYLPTASYKEMMEWSGGYFRNFFVKYPEANNMHKRMLQVSKNLRTLRMGKTLFGNRENEEQLLKALKHLYKAQCSCAYWHGVFGGLYLNFLRHAIYSNLILSEVEMEKFSRRGDSYAEIGVTDLDKDGNDEVILSNNMLNLYFSPSHGGSMFELDYKPRAYNLINSLAKREEDYHEDDLSYDAYHRFSLIDHFLAPDTGLTTFSNAKYKESGDFTNKPYTFLPKRRANEVGLTMVRNGEVEKVPVSVDKNISISAKQSIINIEYKVTNQGEERDEFWFGIEFNLSMLSGDSKDRYYKIKGEDLKDKKLASIGECKNVTLVSVVDGWSGFDVSLELSKPALLWRFPVETLSQSETGQDENYQSSVLFPSWRMRLGAKESWNVKLTLKIEE